jgi:hypothetical protein
MRRGADNRHTVGSVLVGILLSGGTVAVRSARAAVGDGPEQATARGAVVYRSTAVAPATAKPSTPGEAGACGCDDGK